MYLKIIRGAFILLVNFFIVAPSLAIALTNSPDTPEIISRGVPSTVSLLAKKKALYYTFSIPANVTTLTLTTTGGTGDADIYLNRDILRQSRRSMWKSNGDTSDEKITVNSPKAGTYYLTLIAYTAITNVSVVMNYEDGSVSVSPVAPSVSAITNTAPVTALSGTLSGGIATLSSSQIGGSYSYAWSSSAFSACSVSCGVGIQTRDVACLRSDGVTVDASFCTGVKPATSQTCTMQACISTPPVATVVNGSCGTSAGQTFVSVPTTGLCSVGASSAVTSSSSLFVWSCAGVNGGIQASCKATRSVAGTPPVTASSTCGAAANVPVVSAPSTNLCAVGIPSLVTSTSSVYKWTCSGVTTVSCAAAVKFTGSAILGKDTPTTNYIGMGTYNTSDWDESYTFVDMMKHARSWQDAADWHNPVKGIDSNGWPTADASTVIYSGPANMLNGTHKLVFEGQADVSLMWAAGSVTNKKYDPVTNVTTADVTYAINVPSASVGLIFKNTKRTASSPVGSGFTNVRLYREGYPSDGSVVFTTAYLNAMGKVSVVRMMDWSATNGNSVQKWEDRRTPRSAQKPGPVYVGPGGYTFTGSLGVSLEEQILLCNTLHSDCWINIPPVANDDFIKKVALALRYGTDGVNPYTSEQSNPVYPPLNQNSKLYVEYANEVWNSAAGFQSFRVAKDIVDSIPADHPLNTPAESNIWYKVWKYPAYRMVTVSDTFRSVFGDSSMMTRVRPVLMTQQGNGQASLSSALTWLEAYGKRQSPSREVKSYVYGAGGSGYYNPTTPLAAADQSNPDIFFAAGNYPNPGFVTRVGVDAMWATNYGLKRIAYEGGPSLDFYSQDNARRINADPRMQDMIVKTHDEWSKQGGDLLVYYNIRRAGEWEFTPDINNLNTPKLNGLQQLQNQVRMPVTLGKSLPGVISLTDYPVHRIILGGGGYNQTCEGLPCLGGFQKGRSVVFPANSQTSFQGSLTLSGTVYATTSADVFINGVAQGKVIVYPIKSKVSTSNSLAVTIPSGIVAIRFEITDGNMDILSATVSNNAGAVITPAPLPSLYTLTTSAVNGVITTGGTYASGTSVTLTATPNTGYKLSAWTGCVSTTNTCTVVMNGNKVVSATFVSSSVTPVTTSPTTYTLTTSATNGTITTNSTISGIGSGTYASGTSVTLTATPNSGYRFSSWTGCVSTTNICTVVMNGNKVISAIFTAAVATSVTPTPVAVNGSCGTSANQTFTAAPTTNLCGTGTASTVDSSMSSMFMWSCVGVNGGSTASCQASKISAPVVTTPTPVTPTPAIGGVDKPTPNAYNTTWSQCSPLFFGGCSFTGLRDIRYGNPSRWVYKEYLNGFGGSDCNPTVFGVTAQAGDHCEVGDTIKTGTLAAPVTTQHGGMYPTIDLTAIPLGSSGMSTLKIKPTTDFGTSSDIGAFRIPCAFTKMAFNDPIVYPGQPGKSHLHTFFGNTDVNANSTSNSLATTGNSTCAGGIANRSSYWVPALIDTATGKPIPPSDSLWYYKTGYLGVKPSDVKQVPVGLRMIAGSMNATTSQNMIFWGCRSTLVGRGATIPTTCQVGDYVSMAIVFPQCWDGVNLDSPNHQSHMAYATGRGCPATHPVPLPEIALNIHYLIKTADEVKNWRLSSDHDSTKPGISIHADFFEGWNHDVMGTFVTNCLNASKDCHAYLLGNGTMLSAQ